MTAAAAGIKYSVFIRYRGTDCNKGLGFPKSAPNPTLKAGRFP